MTKEHSPDRLDVKAFAQAASSPINKGIDLLDSDPERLLAVKGITKKRLEGMVES